MVSNITIVAPSSAKATKKAAANNAWRRGGQAEARKSIVLIYEAVYVEARVWHKVWHNRNFKIPDSVEFLNKPG